MQAGGLRHRLKVQTKVETRDTRGGVIETWSTDATRWASIQPLVGRQVWEAHQLDARVTHRIVIRNYDGLTVEHRLLEGTSRIFNIKAVRNIIELNHQMEAMVMEQT